MSDDPNKLEVQSAWVLSSRKAETFLKFEIVLAIYRELFGTCIKIPALLFLAPVIDGKL